MFVKVKMGTYTLLGLGHLLIIVGPTLNHIKQINGRDGVWWGQDQDTPAPALHCTACIERS
ncbi:hypothetical protein CDL15_Pgr018129 [Punica granatum]|uniref:Uncharacterized protein n=1 Tax=Punica granatum TaxID=22663 RepID=A0A218WHC4_PUNGR|nr:hypothetical protein CDL15_Pgr018129 [Punica granatum]